MLEPQSITATTTNNIVFGDGLEIVIGKQITHSENVLAYATF